MKTLGLIGGTTWLSTVEYYTNINRMVNERLGGVNSARLLLYSLNFADVILSPDPVIIQKLCGMFISASTLLEKSGADCIVICANTPHMFVDEIQKNIKIPIIHIAEAVAKEINSMGISKVGLLGTKLTMEKDFIKNILSARGISSIIPDESDREFINESIFTELGKNILRIKRNKSILTLLRA